MFKFLLGTTALIAAAAVATAQEVTPDLSVSMLGALPEVVVEADTQVAAQGLATVDPAIAAQVPEFVFRTSPAPIAPFERGVANQVFAGADADDDYVIARGGAAVTVFGGSRDHVSIWAEGVGGFAIDDGEDFFGGSVGPVYRQRIDTERAVGANLFVDGGQTDDGGEFLLSFGAGLEFEQILDLETVETIRFGANGYVPLEDYGNVADFGLLDRAPQLGADAYVRYGRDVGEGARVDLTVAGFGYAQGDASDELYGGLATLGLTVWDGLPEGVALSGYVGPRYATGGDGAGNASEDFDLVGGLGLSYAFGGERRALRSVTVQPRYEPPRDCVVARDDGGRTVYDCTRPVRGGVGGTAKTGEPVRELVPAPQPRIEQVEVTIPGAAPVAPLRHLGYKSPFAPVRR